ncbi:hypothetical protein [Streptomyces sp. NPDC050560]|uniref:hypothetical protein n=1 Tax=Streptomyces sp. NPDC050560 TaxID=3365630 RepID=UPI0037A1A46A
MKVVLGRDDLARAAGDGARAAGAAFERVDVTPVHKAFKGFVNDSSFDVCEIAVVTLLQALAHGKPVVLLPVTTLGRFQHQTLVARKDLAPEAVEGRTVGVRSWSQTTCVWVRGFLTEQYGVDLRKVDWVAYEDGHIREYRDPSWVRRAPEGATLPRDFLDGRVDFGIMGNDLPKGDDATRSVIPDAAQAAAEWSARKGFVPVNHVVAVSETAAREHSDAICAMYDAMRQVAAAEPAKGPVPFSPAGFEALRGPLTQAARYAAEQDVLPAPVDYDDLVARACDALGVPPSRLGGRP